MEREVEVAGRSWGLVVVAGLPYGGNMVAREFETHFGLRAMMKREEGLPSLGFDGGGC